MSHPEETKYRHFRAAQPKIAALVLSQPAAVDILVETGFRTRTQDFQQQWFVPDEWKPDVWAWTRLQATADSLREKAEEWEELVEKTRLNAQREKAVESARKVSPPFSFVELEALTIGLQSRALDEAREDRERVALRVEREKIAREAAAQRQAEEEERAKEEERLRSLEGKNEGGETLHDESKQE